MDINEIVQKVPKPVLVLGILIVSIVFFVFNDPLKDECEVQTAIFEKKTEGILSNTRKNKKTQFSQILYWRDRCKQGNSLGACDDYFEGLRMIAKELHSVNENCQIKYSSQNENLLKHITQALQITALVAWGEKPPAGVADRIGWLNETNIRTFCYLKKTFILIAGEENFLALREKVYNEYPGDWPEKFDFNKLAASGVDKTKPNAEVDIEKLVAENRPRAYKSATNLSGIFNKDQIYERSIFSVRCDLYM